MRATPQELQEMGFKISITGGTTQVVFVSVRKAFQQLKETGLVSPELMGEASDHEEMLKMLGLPQIYDMEKKYGETRGKKEA